MRTAIILAIGFVGLAICLAVGWFSGGPPRLRAAAWIFIALWFVATAANMYIGVTRAGYSFMEELPIFLLLFAVPAIAAVLLRARF
jgi:hypothetical protein